MEDGLDFIIGFAVWIVIGLVAGFLMRGYRAVGTEPWLTIVFGVLGAFVGGMLGSSAHIFHDPTPLRIGGLLGAVIGSIFFSFLYHFMARKAV
jgi:uncharacterized membrane protein YeaQ/YmgE (transglycosylase-associated protein family)